MTRLMAILVTVAAVSGCSTAVPTDDPGVVQLGEYIVRTTGPEVDAVLGYRFASASTCLQIPILLSWSSVPWQPTDNTGISFLQQV